ncbi:MAG: NAD(P)-binding protein, partial [Betaproteobacteria bacterium]
MLPGRRSVSEAPPRASAPLAAVIVGGGFAGIGMAIRLKQAGIHDFLLLEREAGI